RPYTMIESSDGTIVYGIVVQQSRTRQDAGLFPRSDLGDPSSRRRDPEEENDAGSEDRDQGGGSVCPATCLRSLEARARFHQQQPGTGERRPHARAVGGDQDDAEP